MLPGKCGGGIPANNQCVFRARQRAVSRVTRNPEINPEAVAVKDWYGVQSWTLQALCRKRLNAPAAPGLIAAVTSVCIQI